MSECPIYHEPEEKCEICGEMADKYGNTESSFLHCCFPDCGCDGARLCMAPGGASDSASRFNVENMYNKKGKDGAKARMQFVGFIHDLEKKEKEPQP